MLVKQRPVISIACIATSSCHSFSTAAAEGLYEILGLERSASSEDIKSAFRKKAKAHHPDVNESGSTSFAGILRAYQVLSDPAQRDLYDLQHDKGSAGLLRRAAAQKRSQNGQADQSLYNWQWVNNLQETRPARAGSNIDRLRAELAAEFRDALLHAYHGPHVDMSARQLPTAFEADERTDPTSPDILQLLSGRQLLGVVRERKDSLLAGSEEPTALGAPAPAPQQRHGSPPAAGEQRPGPHASSNSTDARQAAASRSRRTHGRWVLELLLGDGDIAATAVMHQAGSSAPVIEVFQDGDCVYREVGGRVFKPSAASAAPPTAAASAAGGAPAASDAAAAGGSSTKWRPTHRALLGRTPLVKHLDWLALRGTGGLKKEQVVGRARRAWLPPSATWLFRPRNATHTTGGWYFEWVGYDVGRSALGGEHPAWLPPTAMVLRAAFETLEAETEATSKAQQEASAQQHSLWQRLKSQLVG